MSMINSVLGTNQSRANVNVETGEADFLASQIATTQAGIETDAMDLQNAFARLDNLDDTIALAAHVNGEDKVQVALVENAVNGIMSGTDATADNLSLGLESFDRHYAAEGLRTVAKNIWEAIKKLMTRIRDRVVKFWKQYFGELAGLRKKLNKLAQKAEKYEGKTIQESKLELGSEIKLVMDEEGVVKESELSARLEKFLGFGEALYGKYAKSVNEAGEELDKAAGEYRAKESDAEKAGKAAIKAVLDKLDVTAVTDAMKDTVDTSDERLTKHDVYKACQVPMASIFVWGASAVKDDAPKAEDYKTLSRGRMTVLAGKDQKNFKFKDEGNIKTWNVSDIRDYIDYLQDAISEVERWEGSSEFKRVDKTLAALKKTGDRIEKDMRDEDAEGTEHGKGIRNLIQGYSRWTSEGFTAYASLLSQITNAVVTISNKSLAQHG